MNFTDEYLDRFSRHIRLPKFGRAGQEKINQAKILIAGAGGLGSAAMTYLASAGVKKICLIDPDVVESSNLPRQIVHKPKNIGQPKVTSAAERLKELNPELELEIIQKRLKAENILQIIPEYDAVIDGTDNFPAKYLLNDACVIAGKPLIHAGVLRYTGQVMTIIPSRASGVVGHASNSPDLPDPSDPDSTNPDGFSGREPGTGGKAGAQRTTHNAQRITHSACYRCIFPEPPPPGLIPTCQEAGILNTVAGILGLIQATEVIKVITGLGKLLTNRLLIFEALTMNFRVIEIRPASDCPVCGKQPTIKALTDLKAIEYCE